MSLSKKLFLIIMVEYHTYFYEREFVAFNLQSPSKYFKVETTGSPQVERFPLYFDIPLVKYEKKDHPWFFETLQLAISE